MEFRYPSLVFLGTPQFALPSLEALLAAGAPILLVVTQPDRPKGRGRKVVASPVKQLALSRGLPVFQPERVGSPEAIGRVEALAPDCLVVVAYGQRLPARLLEIPPLGSINVHASLLPRYRGPAPIHWALIRGERLTGVSAMLLDAGLDTGDILLQRQVEVRPQDTAGTLHDRLAAEGAALLLETLERWQQGTLTPQAQDEARATYAPLLTRADGRLDWRQAAAAICCRIRGLDPWPGAFTWWQGRRLKLFGCEALPASSRARPGRVLAASEEGLQVACGDGEVVLRQLQLEGGRRLAVADFLRGHQLRIGTVFDE